MSSPAKSFSKWATYDQCPRKYKYRYRDKVAVIKTDKNEAALRGTRVHNSVEELFKGTRPNVDEEIQDAYGEWLCSIRDAYECIPELKFALNAEFESCDFDAPDCLVRGYIDLVVKDGKNSKTGEDVETPSIHGYEWKTGKEYPEHMQQKMLYGMILLILFPLVQEVSVTGVYFDQGHNRKIVYKRGMLGTYKWQWLRKFEVMDKDTTCAPNPNFMCKWCDYSRASGGPCSF